MKCPYQTITTVETIKAMARGNEDMQVVKTTFADCLGTQCPLYEGEIKLGNAIRPEYCRRAVAKNENVKS